MEELWENHQNAVENKLDTEFKFMDFYNVGLLSQLSRPGGTGTYLFEQHLRRFKEV